MGLCVHPGILKKYNCLVGSVYLKAEVCVTVRSHKLRLLDSPPFLGSGVRGDGQSLLFYRIDNRAD